MRHKKNQHNSRGQLLRSLLLQGAGCTGVALFAFLKKKKHFLIFFFLLLFKEDFRTWVTLVLFNIIFKLSCCDVCMHLNLKPPNKGLENKCDPSFFTALEIF